MNFSNYKVTPMIIVIGLLLTLSNWGLSYLWGYGYFQGVAPTVIVSSFFILYDKYLWKLPIFKLLLHVPDLSGIYNGHIEYHFQGIDSKKKCDLKIQQTASNIKVTCKFYNDGENSTTSESKEAFFSKEKLNNNTLIIYYHNEGSNKQGDTLNQHDGLNILKISSDYNFPVLEGKYFTNRDPQTKGTIFVKKNQLCKGK